MFCVINEPIQMEKIASGGSLGSGGAFLHVHSSSTLLFQVFVVRQLEKPVTHLRSSHVKKQHKRC